MSHYASTPTFPIFNLVQFPQEKFATAQYPGDVIVPYLRGIGVTIPTYNSSTPSTTMLPIFDLTGATAQNLLLGIYAIAFRGYEDAINTVGGLLFFGVTSSNTFFSPASTYTGNVSFSVPLANTLSIVQSGHVLYLANTWSGNGGTNGTADWVLLKFI